MYTDDQLKSPFSAGDAVYNSLGGIALNFATDWYADNIIENTLSKAAGLNGKTLLNDYDRHATYDPKVAHVVNNRIATQTDGQGYSRARHHMRKSTKNSSILNAISFDGFGAEKKFAFNAAGWIDDVDKRGRKIGLRQAAADLVGDNSIDPVLRDSLKKSLHARAFGVAAFSLGFAQVGFEIGSSVVNSLANKGRAMRTQPATSGMGRGGFGDTQMAYTSRQHAMRAIQLGQSGMRRALGNEASYLHSHN